jgi:dolichol-phosphate mannosyltransferase
VTVSVVIPARDEGPFIRVLIDKVHDMLPDVQVVTVVDTATDGTLDSLPSKGGYWVLVNSYGPGPANAIRFGIDHVTGDTVIVMMADGSDDPGVLPELVRLVEGGAAVACASRYMRGGFQYGGPLVKKALSRAAGLSLWYLARVGTHDATNGYKAYDAKFLKRVVIESRDGFEMGIEMVAKAARLNARVAETPVVWRDRTQGESHFRLRKWVPRYLHWWWYAFGPHVTVSP